MTALDNVLAMTSWARRPFGRLIYRSKETGRPDLQPLSVFLDVGVVPRDERDGNHNRLGADMSSYLVVRPGDIVFNKLRTWQGGLGVSRYTGVVSPAYFVCRPQESVDPRYYHYLLRSNPYLAELTRLSKFMPPSQFDIAWEDLRTLTVLHPPLAQQRAIADCLDAETARIDALIAKKMRLMHLLEERRTVEVETVVRRLGDDHGVVPLKYVAGPITVGIVVTPARWYAEKGTPAVRGVNVSPGHIDMTEAVFLSDEGHRQNAKSTIRSGDLVVVRTGQAGAAAVVPPELDGANCIDLLIVRSAAGVRARFLEYVLNSDWTRKHVSEHSVGSIQAHFNVGSLRELPVPHAPLGAQDASIEYLDRISESHGRMTRYLGRQIQLLLEHRQALITAAVTGELTVPSAA